MDISVIIPSYKNKQMLLSNLQHNLQFLINCEIIVVNDDPTETLKDDFKKFPAIKLIENKQNYGFGKSVNIGVKQSSKNYLLLLNSDVRLINDLFIKARNKFQDSKLFAVTFAQKEKDGSIVGKNRIFWKNGMLQHSKAANMTSGDNGWAEGGSSLFDKKKFIELNGFDEVFLPFYWEDIDLSYRAKKRDYSVIFDSSIIVEHHHESTIGKYFSKTRIKTIAYRNQLITLWKNITDSDLVIDHFIHIPKYILTSIASSDFAFIRGFFSALLYLPYILNQRQKNKRKIKLTDKVVLS